MFYVMSPMTSYIILSYSGDATADEEIIKSLVRCPASKRRPLARDRRRNRLVDRNSSKYIHKHT